MPKGVINTHRMICSNLQMINQVFGFLEEEPPVLVDWLPWNHTFGGNHNTGISLYNGGTFYIDDGRPGLGFLPRNAAQSTRNLHHRLLQRPQSLRRPATSTAQRSRTARNFLPPPETSFLRRRRPLATNVGCLSLTRPRILRRTHHHGHRPRRHRNRPHGHSNQLGNRSRRRNRNSRARSRIKISSARRKTRSPSPRAKYHARLLAPTRTHRKSFRRRRLLFLRRRRPFHRSKRRQQRLPLRRPLLRRFQASQRHLGQRRPIARQNSQPFRAARPRCSSRRPRSRRCRPADLRRPARLLRTLRRRSIRISPPQKFSNTI